jgi:hypothetical protein
MEYLSIHIPKTAGRSFNQNLIHAFGNDNVRYWYREDVFDQAIDGMLPSGCAGEETVWHGHFYFEELRDVVSVHSPRIITWLRDPVERIISHHRFFIKRLMDPPETHKPAHRENLHRKNESLLEFAEYEENRNVMSKILDGLSLDELYFFGMTEYYREDLERLSQKLEVDFGKIPEENSNQGFKTQMGDASESERAMLEEWNALDVTLFDEVKRRLGR